MTSSASTDAKQLIKEMPAGCGCLTVVMKAGWLDKEKWVFISKVGPLNYKLKQTFETRQII